MSPYAKGFLIGVFLACLSSMLASYGPYARAVAGYGDGWRDCTSAVRLVMAVEAGR